MYVSQIWLDYFLRRRIHRDGKRPKTYVHLLIVSVKNIRRGQKPYKHRRDGLICTPIVNQDVS